MIMLPLVYSCLLTLLLCITTGAVCSAQQDHLSALETDRVREAQAIDLRTEVFLKAIERRMIVIMGKTAERQKELKKDQELWGDLPTGTKPELLNDISGILDEAITNIDDSYTRNRSSPLLSKALNSLSGAASILRTQLSQVTKDDRIDNRIDDRTSLEISHINNQVEEIFEAAKRARAK
ncbi:MAG: hypothetical protein ACRD4L_11615 [Pyrinomonadaceae bacterium]